MKAFYTNNYQGLILYYSDAAKTVASGCITEFLSQQQY